MTNRFLAALPFCLLPALGDGSLDSLAPGQRLFLTEVWPTIQSRCLPCHGADPGKIKAGLDLTHGQGAIEGGDSGPALVPGSPEASLLLKAVSWEDENLQMPPKENDRLSEESVERFARWIREGAPWPPEETLREWQRLLAEAPAEDGRVQVATSGGLSEEWDLRLYDQEDLWSWQPLSRPDVPSGEGHPVDLFIQEELDRRGLEAAGQADRPTLLRRAAYGLTGLPPTPEEAEAFLEDPRDTSQALAALVDRLLGSPHYGEHWGRLWLDVVRYADTAGLSNDFDRGNAWRYRDYVVRSFNQDKPWPRFVQEQLAGDELNPEDPEALVATGFLRMGPWELTGMEVAAISRQSFLDDAVNIVGQSFMGHTLRCAKCHDHKFDPIPTRDYYRLYALLSTTQPVERRAPFLPEENTQGFEERKYFESLKENTQRTLDELNRKTREAVAGWFEERGLPYRNHFQAYEAGLGPDEVPPRKYGFTPEDFGRERMGRKTLARLAWELERYEPFALSVYSGATPSMVRYTAPLRIPENHLEKGTIEEGFILEGGDVFSAGEPVEPGSLSALDALVPDMSRIEFPRSVEGRRAALARWMSHPSNPLVTRSIVNRIWQWHFGTPLAANPNNLGASGSPPSHPELLEWLCDQFLRSGGSFKEMHRLIMSSAAWQRSSRHPDPGSLPERDPQGTSYAAFKPRRLSAEELRDSMLLASGELNPQVGGIPARHEIHMEVALQARMVMGTFATAWQPSPLPQQRHRRTLYTLKIRGLRDPFLEVYDQPQPDLSCEARSSSNTAPQVFSLFNGQSAHDRALALATRLERSASSVGDAIDQAFLLAFGRLPSPGERDACLEHHGRMAERHRDLEFEPPVYPLKVLREAVEENTGKNFFFEEDLLMYEDFVPDRKAADAPASTRALADICLVLFNSNEFAYIY